MSRFFVLIIGFLLMTGNAFAGNTRLIPVKLSKEEIFYLKKDLELKAGEYDEQKKMLFTVTRDKHYHSDLDSGVVVHQTRESLEYAVALLKTEDPYCMKRGLDIIKAVLPLQEKDRSYPFCGIWPYYPEDPLRGRKAPVDYNWADFIAVPLIDVIINHSDYVGKDVCDQIKEALILASESIIQRNVQPDYTNICIMGTYVCYVVGDLYGIKETESYARKRLTNFYDYTLRNKGFTEYNSPTYTPVAMDELLRMKQCIVNPKDKKMIDHLYAMCWDVIGRHFHQPSGQWCGPNLRSYNSISGPKLYKLLYNASDGVIDLPGDYLRIPNVIMPHKIPSDILPMFTNSVLPRMEIDTFVVSDPAVNAIKPVISGKSIIQDTICSKDIVGKLYATPEFALASVNQCYMWNQTRPLIAHWGTPSSPSYMQVRFLHDFYDFSAVNIFCAQDSTSVLAILNVAKNGGDKHPGLDRITTGIITASDLRLRIEIGGDLTNTQFSGPNAGTGDIGIFSRGINGILKVPYAQWGNLTGEWIIGKDQKTIYADYVIYSGEEKEFNFNNIQEAVLGLYVSMSINKNANPDHEIFVNNEGGYLSLSNKNLMIKALSSPNDELLIKNDYEISDDHSDGDFKEFSASVNMRCP